MRLLLILVFVFSGTRGYSQSVTKKNVIGTYVFSTGDPARTIQKSDSSFVSISYMEYSRTVLKLKRFGKLTLQTFNNGMIDGPIIKGKWKLKGNIVVIMVNGERQEYTFRLPVYLESMDGKVNYQKE